MFSNKLLDHFRCPRNPGELPAPAITVEVSNPVCGDILRLSARFAEGAVAEVRYKAKGCTASIAAGSALTELMHGRTVAELKSLTPAAIEEAVGGLSAESKHAAILCIDALRSVIRTVGAV
jgi:nitrogen fixation protein NifU and related proteins